MTQLALVIDLNVCVGCHACVTSCKEWNTSGQAGSLVDLSARMTRDPTGTFFNRVQTFEVGEFPDTRDGPLSKVVSPLRGPPLRPGLSDRRELQASRRRPRAGRLRQVHRLQILRVGVPYGVRELDEDRKVMGKCTLCVDRIDDEALPEAERKPACVLACPTNARLYGDIHDPESDVSEPYAKMAGIS